MTYYCTDTESSKLKSFSVEWLELFFPNFGIMQNAVKRASPIEHTVL